MTGDDGEPNPLATRYGNLQRGRAPGRFEGVDRQTGATVIVKELTLGRIDDWKQLELFERETQVLEQLDHPGIPALLDRFETTDGDSPRYYLVCEDISGRTLAEAIERGDLQTESDARDVARGVLEVLVYLQSFSPPVLHRDIHPETIVLGSDGQICLVDFGSVAVRLESTVGGSTVVGTSGYTAPEQLFGRAVPASDLYGLGTSLVHLLTEHAPRELPARRMKLQWRDRVPSSISSDFVDFVDRLVDPDPSARPADAAQALRWLEGAPIPTAGESSIPTASDARPYTDDPAPGNVRRSERRLRIEFSAPRSYEPTALGCVHLISLVVGTLLGVAVFVGSLLVAASLNLSGMAAGLIVGAGFLGGIFTLVGIRRVGYEYAHARHDEPSMFLELDRLSEYRIRSADTSGRIVTGEFHDVLAATPANDGLHLVTHTNFYHFPAPDENVPRLVDEITTFLRDARSGAGRPETVLTAGENVEEAETIEADIGAR